LQRAIKFQYQRYHIGSSHARPNLGLSGDLLSENEAMPAVLMIDAMAMV